MLALLLLAVSFHTHFEAGNIGKVETLAENHFRCKVPGESDQAGRNHQPSWFYFRMDDVADLDLTIDLVGFEGEYDYQPHEGNVATMQPSCSSDGRNWTHFAKNQLEWIARPATLRIRCRPTGNHLFIARVRPYTNGELKRWLDDVRGHPCLQQAVVGKTAEGRPMLLLTVTNPKVADTGKKIIWLMARQHSWEAGTSWAVEGALRFLLSDDERAAEIRDQCMVKLFPMADPDGVVRGGVRFNKFGYDLNRNWDNVDAKLTPEIYTQRKAILDWVDSGHRLDLFLTIHETETIDYLSGPLSAGGKPMREIGERFYRLLDQTKSFYAPPDPRSNLTPGGPVDVESVPIRKGRSTVCQGLFQDRKIPAFTLEMMVDFNQKLGHPPNWKDRAEYGAEIVQAMALVVTGK
jgi:murein tripeptide amidase MpaA